jgi:hypothetical protein
MRERAKERAALLLKKEAPSYVTDDERQKIWDIAFEAQEFLIKK